MLQRSSAKLTHYNRGAQRPAAFATVLRCRHIAAAQPSGAEFAACDASGVGLPLRTGSTDTSTRALGTLHSQPRPCGTYNLPIQYSERGPITRRRRVSSASSGDLLSVRHGSGCGSSRGCGGDIGDSARSSSRTTVGVNSGRRSKSTAALKEDVDGDGARVLQRPTHGGSDDTAECRGGSSTAEDGGSGDLIRRFLLTGMFMCKFDAL